MCFSASASFIAAGILAGIGLKTLEVNKQASYRMMALTPLLFAIQQASEGMVWLTIATEYKLLCQVATYVFLIFACIIWPLWSPLACLSLEGDATRRNKLWVLTGIATFVASYSTWSFFTVPITAKVLCCSIDYGLTMSMSPHAILALALYITATIIPCFISSLKYGWLLGSAWLAALVVTLIFKYETTTSVWCFFAAILSVLILMAIKREQEG